MGRSPGGGGFTVRPENRGRRCIQALNGAGQVIGEGDAQPVPGWKPEARLSLDRVTPNFWRNLQRSNRSVPGLAGARCSGSAGCKGHRKQRLLKRGGHLQLQP